MQKTLYCFFYFLNGFDYQLDYQLDFLTPDNIFDSTQRRSSNRESLKRLLIDLPRSVITHRFLIFFFNKELSLCRAHQ